MVNILVAGAASGIGKEFVRAYLKDSINNIYAVDRHFAQPSSLSSGSKDDYKSTYRKAVDPNSTAKGRLYIYTFDITDEDDVRSLAQNSPESFELLIQSAGIRGLASNVPINESSDVAHAETMNVMNAKALRDTFNVNAVGTFLLLKAMTPKLCHDHQGKAIIMGSRMGSIGHNTVGGAYAYRASKAALNAIIKSFAVDEPKVIFTIIHPGRVQSGLVSVKEAGAMSAEESVGDMLRLIERLNKEDSGRFFDRFGAELPW